MQNTFFFFKKMGNLFHFMSLCFCLCLLSHSPISVTSEGVREYENAVEGIAFINGTAPIASTDDNYICATLDWWPPQKCDYGRCSWNTNSILNLDLSNPIFLNAIKAFSRLKIRIGGTLQDKVVYERIDDEQTCRPFVKNNKEMFGFSQGCLPMSRWDELNSFFKESGAIVTFGLNALSGRTINSKGFATGAWNSSDAEYLIRYSVKNGYPIYGWELGNELCGKGIGARITADQYASDVQTLQDIMNAVYGGFEVKPQVIAPGGFFDANWFTEFVEKTPNLVQVITHHIYNVGPGSDNHLVGKILDPLKLDGGSQPFSSLQNILRNTRSSAVAWVGEGGGVYNSGRNLVTNAFVFSFWYLDQLGMAASYDTKTYCRQTLIGGNYGLLNTATFAPNPDYYSALLWHRLMGSKALYTKFSETKKIRAYAHCSKTSRGITLLLMNLDANTTVQVRVSAENEVRSGGLTQQQEKQREKVKSAGKYREGTFGATCARKEYHLTAKDGDLHSQTMLLNGKILAIDSFGTIPPLPAKIVSMSAPVAVTPFSIVFAHIPCVTIPACIQNQ